MSFIKNLYLLNTVSKKPFTLISDHLPIKVLDKMTFYMSDKSFSASFSLDLMQKVIGGIVIDDPSIEYYRNTKSRKIYKLSSGDQSIAVKSFSFNNSFSKKLFRHKLYSRDEASNLILAKKMSLPVPEVYCYGEQIKGLFCYRNLVATEFIEDSFHPNDVFWGREEVSMSFEEIMNRLKPLFLKLYFSGCNHIDTHGHTFFINKSDSALDKIIDFQFAVFLDSPNNNVFNCQVSHLIRRVKDYFEKEFLDEWVYSLFKDAGIKNMDSQLKGFKSFMSSKELGAFERMCLK